MPQNCGKCRVNPGTAGPDPLNPQAYICVSCAAIETLTIPVAPERRDVVPDVIANGPAWAVTQDIRAPDSTDNSMWLHQARALQELAAGNNVGIATPTASGKSRIFQLWTIHQLKTDPEATALVFYPTKALANDQTNSWNRRCADADMPENTVDQINGDVPMNRRDGIINISRVVIMTPDVCHAWLTRNVETPAVKKFLKGLRTIIIDEAHTYESIFGSNSAYLFRRLITACITAGNPKPPQYIAATATILEPETHLNRLTGQEFRVIDQEDNGAPRFSRTLHHLPYNPRQFGHSSSQQMAELVVSIIDNDPGAQVIAFHDSRQGIERIVQNIGRPDIVMPYRSGYLAEDRLDIESRLRDGKIRAVITTSALELGIDMPDLNYGINLDLPPTRKSFHQRLGRVGRTAPGTFIILAPPNRFSDFGDTMQHYYDNSVEPSLLYLDNEYITYQQAKCLKNELENSRMDTRALPKHCVWPVGFDMALRNAHGKPPAHLSNINLSTQGRAPQLAHSLRSSGEEDLKIFPNTEGEPRDYNGRGIGTINISAALREAYPAAIYRHMGESYTVDEWVRNPQNRQGIIKVTSRRQNQDRTKPMTRHMATLQPDDQHINKKRTMAGGHLWEIMINMTRSVEGYKMGNAEPQYYQDLRKNDPRKTRKQMEFPTSGVHIRIAEPWFSGDTGWPWQARYQISEALRVHLAYHRSIPLAELSSMVENIVIKTPQGYYLSNDSILVYDNIQGGLGLVQHLYDELPLYAQKLVIPEDQDDDDRAHNSAARVNKETAQRFLQWLERDPGTQADPIPEPGPKDWWRTVTKGSEVTVYSEERNGMFKGTVMNRYWDEGIKYQIRINHEVSNMTDENIKQAGANFDYELWNPDIDRTTEFYVNEDTY